MNISRYDSDQVPDLSRIAPAPSSRPVPQSSLPRASFTNPSTIEEHDLSQYERADWQSSTPNQHLLNSAYHYPPPPPPPALPTRFLVNDDGNVEHTYSRASSHERESVRKNSLLERLGTVVPRRLSRQQGYGVLGEDDRGQRNTYRNSTMNVEDHIMVDLSGFEGPVASGDISTGKGGTVGESGKSTGTIWTSQYERPENSGISRLGAGMGTIRRARIEAVPSFERTVLPTESYLDLRARDEIQRAAENRGEIMMLEEKPTVDIGHLGGDNHVSSPSLSSSDPDVKEPVKNSYFFPKDPDMPNWRPFSMHWTYISFLTILALGLAGLQEYLCQLSLQKAEKGGGLLGFIAPQDISMMDFFLWKYAPTLILVSYGILWQIIEFDVKRLEPYYQLSRPSGALAAESLNIDYLTFISYLTPIKALRYRQMAVSISTVATLLASGLIPTLQSAALDIYPDEEERRSKEHKYVRVDPAWSRATSITLGIVALCGIYLLFQLRRKSGLMSDPNGIAGIAAMATRSHILEDFRGLDTASPSIIHKQLRHRRYILHKSSLWQGAFVRNTVEKDEDRKQKPENPKALILRLEAGVPFIGYMVLCSALLPLFIFVEAANDFTEKLPFLLVLLATSIKLLWNSLDSDIRLLEPFYWLSRRHAPPQILTLDYTGTIPGWIVIKSAMNKHFIVATVGLGSIMCEVLTVCVSSFSVDGRQFFPENASSSSSSTDDEDDARNRLNSGETYKSFWISFALSEIILILLCIMAAITYIRRRHKFLPREPGTIASVLAYIHQSNMLKDFIDTEKLDSRAMTAHLKKLNKTYALGWFIGRDGLDHCGIDAEEIRSGYQYGVDCGSGHVIDVGNVDQL